MPSDSSSAADVLALWPVVAAISLAVCSAVALAPRIGDTARVVLVTAGAVLTSLSALGLWAWLLSDATRYHDASSHLDHTSSTAVVVAVACLLAALALSAAALRRIDHRGLVAAALAMSALACLAQTYGFLGYTTPG